MGFLFFCLCLRKAFYRTQRAGNSRESQCMLYGLSFSLGRSQKARLFYQRTSEIDAFKITTKIKGFQLMYDKQNIVRQILLFCGRFTYLIYIYVF